MCQSVRITLLINVSHVPSVRNVLLISASHVQSVRIVLLISASHMPKCENYVVNKCQSRAKV